MGTKEYTLTLTTKELALVAVAMQCLEQSEWTIDLTSFQSMDTKVSALVEQALTEVK